MTGPLPDELVAAVRCGPLLVRHQNGDECRILVGQPVQPCGGKTPDAGLVSALVSSAPR